MKGRRPQGTMLFDEEALEVDTRGAGEGDGRPGAMLSPAES